MRALQAPLCGSSYGGLARVKVYCIGLGFHERKGSKLQGIDAEFAFWLYCGTSECPYTIGLTFPIRRGNPPSKPPTSVVGSSRCSQEVSRKTGLPRKEPIKTCGLPCRKPLKPKHP